MLDRCLTALSHEIFACSSVIRLFALLRYHCSDCKHVVEVKASGFSYGNIEFGEGLSGLKHLGESLKYGLKLFHLLIRDTVQLFFGRLTIYTQQNVEKMRLHGSYSPGDFVLQYKAIKTVHEVHLMYIMCHVDSSRSCDYGGPGSVLNIVGAGVSHRHAEGF